MVTMQSSVFLFILGAFVVVHAYKDSPKGLHFVGVGYNLLKGNPEGGDLSNGGVDPGLLVTRNIFQLTWKKNKVTADNKYKVPDQVIFAPRASCVTTTKKEVFSGSKSYQNTLNIDVHASAKYGVIKLLKFAFTLSSKFEQVKKQTSKYHNVFYEEKKVCNRGRARYQLGLAPYVKFQVSVGFAAALCGLPGSYNQQAYFHFIENWGTHIVVEVELGEKRIERYKSSSTEFTKYAMKNMQNSVSVSGSYMGFSASLKVDVKMFRESMSQGTKFGENKVVFKSGGAHMPEPIGLKLVPITAAFNAAFYKIVDQLPSYRCVHSSSFLAIRKSYVKRALVDYPLLKRAVKPVDPEVRIPLTWPEGTYGLQMPKSGCPKESGFQWHKGTRFHDTEDDSGNNLWSSPYDLAGNVQRNNMEQKFCMKTLKGTQYSLPWPKGEYCILKKGNCPADFKWGYIHWDDEDSNNRNTYSGQLPDGWYDRNTNIYYCCRSDGHATNAICLPTDSPFVLLKSSNRLCQDVKGMRCRSGYFQWDCEDSRPNNYASDRNAMTPRSSVGRNIRIDYCYYYR